MRLKASLQGNLKQYMEAEFRAAEKAVTLGIREATQGLKMSMHRQVISKGLGPRMANTWRGEVYPKGQNSIRAAGLVFSNARKIMVGFEEGAVIRSHKGWWLAIPTPNAPKRGVNGKKINPSNFPEQRYGKLRFVYRRNGSSLLVADKMKASYDRKTGAMRGFRKANAQLLPAKAGRLDNACKAD